MEEKEKNIKEVKDYAKFFQKLSSFLKKLPVSTLIIGALFILLLLYELAGSKVSISGETTDLGFKDIGELATQAAFYTEVIDYKEMRDLFDIKVPFTQSRAIYSYDGIIKAGLDFGKIDYSIKEEEKKIYITLPKAKILSNEIDTKSLNVYDETQNIFTPINVEDYNSAVDEVKERAEKKAIENGLLDLAKDNAKVILEQFFKNEYIDYTIVY